MWVVPPEAQTVDLLPNLVTKLSVSSNPAPPLLVLAVHFSRIRLLSISLNLGGIPLPSVSSTVAS